MLSMTLERDIEDMILKLKQDHRIGRNITIILTPGGFVIDPENPKNTKKPEYMFGYGLGYQAGLNANYDKLYPNKTINTKNIKNYQ